MESNRFSRYTQRDIDFLKSRAEHPYIYHRTQRLLGLVFQDQPKAVLEVGCGDGIALEYIHPVTYVGVDTSFARLQAASIRNRDYTFIHGNGTCLPIHSEQFDLVFCMGTLHHLPKQGAFLMIQEMSRVCKNGGWIAIIEPNAYNPSSFLLGLLRKPERGILHCRPAVFLKSLKKLGMHHEIRFEYIGTFSPMHLVSDFFKKKDFVRTPWFVRLWERTDSIANRIIAKRFWTSMVIMARKGSQKEG